MHWKYRTLDPQFSVDLWNLKSFHASLSLNLKIGSHFGCQSFYSKMYFSHSTCGLRINGFILLLSMKTSSPLNSTIGVNIWRISNIWLKKGEWSLICRWTGAPNKGRGQEWPLSVNRATHDGGAHEQSINSSSLLPQKRQFFEMRPRSSAEKVGSWHIGFVVQS